VIHKVALKRKADLPQIRIDNEYFGPQTRFPQREHGNSRQKPNQGNDNQQFQQSKGLFHSKNMASFGL
jgi:hypothetical protein